MGDPIGVWAIPLGVVRLPSSIASPNVRDKCALGEARLRVGGGCENV